MRILEEKLVPEFEATCKHCKSRFVYTRKDVTPIVLRGYSLPLEGVLDCPVCMTSVDCKFQPHNTGSV